MLSYKDENLVEELKNDFIIKKQVDIDEEKANDIKDEVDSEEILSYLIREEFNSSPGLFPIDYLIDQIDSDGSFPSFILNNEDIFNNVLHFILTPPDSINLDLDPPENYKKCKNIPELQSTQLVEGLYYIDTVISQNEEALNSLPDEFLIFLLKMIYCSNGKSCQWALHILTIISSHSLERLEEYQFVSRIGEIIKYCIDESIKCFALQALEPFFAQSDDYKRKKRIFDFIHSKFSQMSPKLKQSTLSLFEEYIQSSEKDMKYAARNNLLQDCISLLSSGRNTLLTKQACFVIYYFINNDYQEFLQDSITQERLIQQLRLTIESTQNDVIIPSYILLNLVVKKATPSLPLFEKYEIPKKVCDTILNGTLETKKFAASVLSQFILSGDAELLTNIVNQEVILPILDIFASLDHETQITFLQGLLHLFSMDVSVYEPLDPDDLFESLEGILNISHEIDDLAQFVIDRIHELQQD